MFCIYIDQHIHKSPNATHSTKETHVKWVGMEQENGIFKRTNRREEHDLYRDNSTGKKKIGKIHSYRKCMTVVGCGP